MDFATELRNLLILGRKPAVIDARRKNSSEIILGTSQLLNLNHNYLVYVTGREVRVSKVNPFENAYVNIGSNSIDFDVCGVSFNGLGTLMAIVGDSSVVMTTISGSPTNFRSLGEYKLQGLTGKIKKVLWQEAAANDCTFVVLLDNSQVLLYDLTVSVTPQIIVDLKDKGSISLICFGSGSLSGQITLYVVSDEVHAVFPFTYSLAKIVATEKMVEEAYLEAKELLSEDTMLQFKYFEHLYKQLQFVAPMKELRDQPYLVFDQLFPKDFTPTVQGPLCKVNGAIDITAINGIEMILLSGCSVSYFAQLAPLTMRFAEIKQSEQYVKPKRGFGFEVIVPPRIDASLTQVAIDKLPVDVGYFKTQGKSLYLAGLNAISLDFSQWDVVNMVLETKYKALASGQKDFCTLIDSIEDGHYLIVIKDGVEVKRLDDNADLTKARLPSEEPPRKTLEYSVLAKIPFSDIDNKQKLISNLGKGLSGNFPAIEDLTSDDLKRLNTISMTAANDISKAYEFIIDLSLRVQTQLGVLRSQVTLLDSFNVSNEVKEQNKIKIEKLVKRQTEIEERMNAFYLKLVTKLRQKKSSISLPLSLAEKEWFAELNSITSDLKTKKVSRLNDFNGQVKALKLSQMVPIEKTAQQDLVKAYNWLQREGKLLEISKSKIEAQLQKIQGSH